jgi:hypothetical protein
MDKSCHSPIPVTPKMGQKQKMEKIKNKLCGKKIEVLHDKPLFKHEMIIL